MNKLIIVLIGLTFGFALRGQNLEKLFVGSGGGYFKDTPYPSLVSIGEPVSGYIQGNAVTAEQGFAAVEEGNGPLAVKTTESRIDLSLYPNPFKGDLFIKVPSGIRVDKVEIINILGVKVLERTISNSDDIIQLDGLADLPEGIYLIAVYIGDKKQIYRINHQ